METEQRLDERKNQATELQTMKETPPQDTKAAAAKEQLRAATIRKDLKSGPKFDQSDPLVVQADVSRRNWIRIWTGKFGSYEDITSIPPMIYTDKKLEPGYSPFRPMETLQIFSVKIVETSQNLTWPLDVFGMVVARDALDYNRNIIFHRTRDNCQAISKENPYLELTGPSRAVVAFGSVDLEVMLQVKRGGQAKDKCISYLVVSYDGCPSRMESCVLKRVRPNKRSTVELTFGSIYRSVEATISVQVVGGSWTDGFRGEFTASTISLDDMKIQLLAFGDGKLLPVAADGMVKLVVSVELKGELRVSVRAVGVGDEAVEKWVTKVFRAQKASRSKAYLEVGSCKVKVTIAWSLLSSCQYPGGWSPE
uniref:Uncharacterized protein n=1 Tax=Avena sativa TaxID=4498 RepID=A0ACD5XGE1_AVESA